MRSSAPEPTVPATTVPDAGRNHTARRPRRVGAGILALVIVAVGLTIAIAKPFAGSGGGGGGVIDSAYPTATATVSQGPLSSYTEETGTLGYAAEPDGSPYSVVNRAGGTLTALPAPGRVIRQGEALYRVT